MLQRLRQKPGRLLLANLLLPFPVTLPDPLHTGGNKLVFRHPHGQAGQPLLRCLVFQFDALEKCCDLTFSCIHKEPSLSKGRKTGRGGLSARSCHATRTRSPISTVPPTIL